MSDLIHLFPRRLIRPEWAICGTAYALVIGAALLMQGCATTTPDDRGALDFATRGHPFAPPWYSEKQRRSVPSWQPANPHPAGTATRRVSQ